jgi:hypothetical protein
MKVIAQVVLGSLMLAGMLCAFSQRESNTLSLSGNQKVVLMADGTDPYPCPPHTKKCQ